MKRKLLYLINPISGTRNKVSLQELIEARTQAAGFAYAIHHTVAEGGYSHLLALLQKEQFTDVVIAGGDGTINSVVNGLRGEEVRFGILPCGSGNGLALSAGIPKAWPAALDVVFKGQSKLTDGFMVNDRFACMLCGLGFDAQVAHDFAKDPRRGLMTYVKKTVAHFFSAKAYPFTLAVNGRAIATEAFFISIANSNQFGNRVTIAPRASLNDGLLDIVVMTRQNKMTMLLRALKQIAGLNPLQDASLANEKASVLYFQTPSLQIANPSKAPMHIDGDPMETSTHLDIRILPQCFQLLQP